MMHEPITSPVESLLTSIKNELFFRKMEEYRLNPYAVVYHMGKVGSTSIVLSILQNGYMAHHCQWVSDETVEFFNYFAGATTATGAVLHNKQTEYYRAMFADKEFARHIKIISIVRDPIANMLSFFFHNMPSILRAFDAKDPSEISPQQCCDKIGELCLKFLDFRDMTLTDYVDLCKSSPDDVTLQRFAVFFYMLRNPLHFYDEEIKKYIGVDVYADPFPKDDVFPAEKKFRYFDNVLVLRFEELSVIAESVIAEYLQIQNFQMIKSNVGEEKDGGILYREVKNTIRFPTDFLDYVYSSKYANHFYSTSEIERFRKRWS
jgi:hypothetical protein